MPVCMNIICISAAPFAVFLGHSAACPEMPISYFSTVFFGALWKRRRVVSPEKNAEKWAKKTPVRGECFVVLFSLFSLIIVLQVSSFVLVITQP